MKYGIIFDLDGTLWDACAQIADSWNEYLRNNAPEVPPTLTTQDLRSSCGLTMTAIGDRLFPQIPNPRRLEITEGCCAYEIEYLKGRGGDLYPYMEETLAQLKEKYELYIVSNCQKGYIEIFLEWSGTEKYFSDIECFGNTGLEKDENITLLIRRNAVDRAVYVGDTIMDYKSACAAGIPFIHASYGFGAVADVPFIETMAQLSAAAEEIFRF